MPAPTPSPFDSLPEPPFPVVILLGCQPNLMPPPKVAVGPCPVCGGAIRPEHPRYYCAQCDGMSPSNEAKALGARLGLKARSESEVAEGKLRNDLRRKAGGAVLSEHDRRLIWNGYRGAINRQLEDKVLGVYGRVGRQWLIDIEQVPDYSLILDRHGRVIGRYEPEAAPAGSPAA